MLMIKTGRQYRAATKNEILEAASQYHVKATLGAHIGSPGDSRALFVNMLRGREHEVFVVAYVNTRHFLIACDEIFRGTIDGASVHPREVVKAALQYNAAAVIVAHNHPSGLAEPSQADELITLRLRDALALVEVRLLDHIIVAGDQTTSLAERGLI